MRLRRLSRWAIAFASVELALLILLFVLLKWNRGLITVDSTPVIFCIIAVSAKVIVLLCLPILAKWNKLAGALAEVTAVLGFLFAAMFALIGGLLVLVLPLSLLDDSNSAASKVDLLAMMTVCTFLIACCAFASALCINKVVPILDARAETLSTEAST